MSLRDRLAQLSKIEEADTPPATQAIMRRAVEELRASGACERVIKVGAHAPDFDLVDQNRQQVRLSDLRKQGPVILSFYRGVWCPFCNEDLKALQETHGAILNAGATLVAISPQTPPNSRKAVRMLELSFPVLSDIGGLVSQAYGLRYTFSAELRQVYEGFKLNLADFNGDDSWTLPMPARVVVNEAGIVTYAESSPDYERRPEPDEVLAHLAASRTPPN